MIKRLLLLLLLIVPLKGATISFNTVSSNQFKLGTNSIYLNTITNDLTLSNNFLSLNYVSSNRLVTSNWTSISAANLTGQTLSVSGNTTSSNLTVTNLFTVVGGSSFGSRGLTFLSILSTNASLDFPATTTNQVSILNITLPGAGTNGAVFLNIVTPDTNFIYSAYIGVTNTVTVRAANISTNDAVNPSVTDARVVVFQY